MSIDDKLKALADLITKQQREEWIKKYTHEFTETASIKPGKKYTWVEVGTSGKYMVVNETGEIFGIKAYSVIPRGHAYGTLDTINDWYWGGYTAVRGWMVIEPDKREYQPKTGARCTCRPGVERDNCGRCEGTGWVIDFAAIRAR